MLLDAPVAWQPMKVIGGRFTLLGRLAFGGMADVWLARQSGPQGFNRMVVVKRVLEARSHEAEIVQMFVEEARLGGLLTHPNIVQTVDFGEDGGVPFIVLEYLFGETLGAVAKTCRNRVRELPIPLAVRIISDATLGLSSAHELRTLDGKPLGIVHRDVSPQNILVTYDGVVKVLDFGIARSVDRASYTDQTQVRGRITYMSPEQMAPGQLDQRADVFSLGVVLWEAVTGVAMHHNLEPSDAMVVMKLLSTEEPLPSARKLNKAVPEELELIIAHALEKNRDRRYATSALFRGALEAWLRKLPEQPTQTAVAALMTDLFSERQHERTRVLQRLSSGRATPQWTPSVVDALAPARTVATDPRLDVQNQLETGVSPLQHRGRVVQRSVAAALVLMLALLAVALYALTRPGAALPQSVAAAAPAAPRVTPEPRPEVVVKSEPVAPAAPMVAPEPQPEVAVTVAPVVVAAPAAPPALAAPAKPRPAAKAAGRLRLDSDPWTSVFLKGKKLGDTPLIDLRVPAGQLELLLVNEDAKIRTTITIDVAAGETTVKRLQF